MNFFFPFNKLWHNIPESIDYMHNSKQQTNKKVMNDKYQRYELADDASRLGECTFAGGCDDPSECLDCPYYRGTELGLGDIGTSCD